MEHDVFEAIADPTRREIVSLLSTRPLPVQALAQNFTITRPAISRHLKVLRQAGLVSENKVGRQRLYRLQPERLREVREWVLYFDQFWLAALGRLKTLVEENPDGHSTD
jgi:DNA-binding transcriptional ArsR family regulator